MINLVKVRTDHEFQNLPFREYYLGTEFRGSKFLRIGVCKFSGGWKRRKGREEGERKSPCMVERIKGYGGRCRLEGGREWGCVERS